MERAKSCMLNWCLLDLVYLATSLQIFQFQQTFDHVLSTYYSQLEGLEMCLICQVTIKIWGSRILCTKSHSIPYRAHLHNILEMHEKYWKEKSTMVKLADLFNLPLKVHIPYRSSEVLHYMFYIFKAWHKTLQTYKNSLWLQVILTTNEIGTKKSTV